MIQKKFRVQQFIALLLLLNPYRNNIEITNLFYYAFIAIMLCLKYLKERARPKTILIIIAYFTSILQMYYSKVYTLTAFLCFLNLFYPHKIYYMPPISQNIGYKQFTIPGKYNSRACAFFPCITGDVIEINWVIEQTIPKIFQNRNNKFKRFYRLFKFIFSFLNTYKLKVRNGQVTKSKGVIIFSHGAGGIRHAYTHFLSELAKQHIVVTIQHDQIPLQFNQQGQQLKYRSQQLEKRTNSILQTLNYFKKQTNIKQLLGVNYKQQSFFLMGHSYGGATILNTNYVTDIQNQVDGIILIDSWYRPIKPQRYDIPLKANIISIYFQNHIKWQQQITQFARKLYQKNPKKYEQYVIKSGSHMDITDFIYVIGSVVPIQSSKNCQSIMHTTIEIVSKFINTKISPDKQQFKNKLVNWTY